MQLKYDLDVRALYARLSDHAVERTQEIDDNTNVDLDRAGGVVGIEVISIDHAWPLDEILRSFDIPAAEAAQLTAYFQARATLLPQAHQVSAKLSVPAMSAA